MTVYWPHPRFVTHIIEKQMIVATETSPTWSGSRNLVMIIVPRTPMMRPPTLEKIV